MPITPAQVQTLQEDPKTIRNICILAHVDHGKTTLSDSLIATNGIISSKLAGQVRYLDSRPDEQERGITMKASAIALYFKLMGAGATPDAAAEGATSEYIVNLIDCPGHVDFTSEVSTASRLCDGALVLVDAVEGVSSQTLTVLHQAWKERIKPVLVINKLDRLATELRMTAAEAYAHVAKIIQHANAVVGTFFQSDLAHRDAVAHERQKARTPDLANSLRDLDLQDGAESPSAGGRSGTATPASGVEEEDDEEDHAGHGSSDEDIYFSPQAGNVVFASAIHGWAFRIQYFARLYAAKLKIKEETLLRFLWGEYYLDPKTKRILQPKQVKGRDMKPLAVQFMFDNVWAIYEACGLTVTSESEDLNMDKIEKISGALKLKVHPRELKRTRSGTAVASHLLNQWLPLSTAVLLAVIQQTPSPSAGQPLRLPRVFPFLRAHPARESVFTCSTAADAPAIAFISKMVAVPAASLPQYRRKAMTAEELRARRAELLQARRALEEDSGRGAVALDSADDAAGRPMTPEAVAQALAAGGGTASPAESAPEGDVMIGMARLYSGRMRCGDSVYVLGPKYDPAKPDEHCVRVAVEHLYVLMGRDVEEVEQITAGNIFGIAGAALEASVLKAATLSSTTAFPSLAALESHAAPIVRVALEPSNPADMPKLIEGLRLLNQADPAVEVILQETGEHVILTAGELHLERCLVDLRERFAKCPLHVGKTIVPFRETIVDAPPQPQFQNEDLPIGTAEVTTPNKLCSLRIRAVPLPTAVTDLLSKEQDHIKSIVDDPETHKKAAKALLHQIQAVFDKEGGGDPQWKDVTRRLWAFGPKRTGPNILVNDISEYARPTWVLPDGDEDATKSLADFDNGVTTGFHLATNAGPLCNEPMHGVAFFVERVEWPNSADLVDGLGATQGQAITASRECCRSAFLARSPRLLLATYLCEVQCVGDALGMVYGAVSRCRGRIVAEDMREGTPYFVVTARLPVIESFGFADDMRKRTSGGATPQLVFAGWDLLDLDPFWVPTTEEELEELGTFADRENVARKYMDAVRRRKGMFVEEKIVEHAEKQRTLMKK